MNRSTAGFSVLHNLQEFAQTHVHCVSNAIQPSHPLSSPSPLAFNLSQQDGQLWEDNLSAPAAKLSLLPFSLPLLQTFPQHCLCLDILHPL